MPISALARLNDNEIDFGKDWQYMTLTAKAFHRIDYVMLKSEWETGGATAAERLAWRTTKRKAINAFDKDQKMGQ